MNDGQPINILDFIDAVRGNQAFYDYVEAARDRAIRGLIKTLRHDIWGNGQRRIHVRGYYRRQRRIRRHARHVGDLRR